MFRRKPIVAQQPTIQNTTSIFGTSTNNPVPVTSDSAMRTATVYQCNKILAETIASLPLKVINDDHVTEFNKKNLERILKRKPNPFQTSMQWREGIVTDLNFEGNSYHQITRNHFGDVTGIYPLKKENITIKQRTNGKLVYIYKQGQDDIYLKDSEVLHFKGISLNGITGISPIAYNADTITTEMATTTFGNNYFANGANSNIVISHPNILKDEAYQRLKDSVNEKYIGLGNSHKPMLLEDGTTIEKITISNNESQFLDTRKYTKADIAGIFNVPLHLINELGSATHNNVEALSLDFVKYTLVSWFVRLEQEMTNKLLSEEEQDAGFNIRHNADALLRGSLKDRYISYEVGIRAGWMNRNEARAKENLAPVKELEDYLVSANYNYDGSSAGDENNKGDSDET